MENNPIYILKAIKKLNPSAEVTIIADDFSTLEYIKIEGKKPTEAEIIATIPKVIEEEKETLKAWQDKRESAKNKLAALGLDPEEVSALLG